MRALRLSVSIKASPLLATALLLAHGGAIACAVIFLRGWWMPGVAAAGIAASLAFHLGRDALQLSGKAVTGLTLKEGARCELTLRDGETLTGTIDPSTFVAPLLIVINVRPDGRGRRRAAILMPDSAPAQELRRVRVWLRHRVRPDTPGSGPL
jgi:toxin CptA